ncbi:MAG: sulfatase-like hydrolase/transferase [Spirosomataceae bacterium]
MKKKMIFILANVLFVSFSGKKDDKDTLPNFVIIMADDLGYGDISCYGNTYINTPNIDKLASEGIRFIDFHSNGAVCSPTRAALMTGKYQQRTGVESVITAKNHRHVGLSLDEITIAEELKKYNYNCGMYGKWHLGYSKEYNPTLQGFDDYSGFVSGNIDYNAHIDQEGYLDWWKGTNIDNEEGYSTDLITKKGVRFIQENNPQKKGKPFFLYLTHEAPHSPYQRRMSKVLRENGVGTTEPIMKDSIRSIYKEMVEVMDEGIGKVIDALKETGQYKNTIVIFLSDNGANTNGSNGDLRGYKGDVYEGGSRVPAIISYPDKIKKGMVNNQTILTMDILPTLLDFIDKKPTGKKVDGISIKNNLLYQVNLPERAVFFAYNNRSFIRSGKWKMIHIKEQNKDRFELYNLSIDLKESKDVGLENPILLNNMKEELMKWEVDVRKGVKKVSSGG